MMRFVSNCYTTREKFFVTFETVIKKYETVVKRVSQIVFCDDLLCNHYKKYFFVTV